MQRIGNIEIFNSNENMAPPVTEMVIVQHETLVNIVWNEYCGQWGECSACGGDNVINAKFCNWCGAKLDGKA